MTDEQDTSHADARSRSNAGFGGEAMEWQPIETAPPNTDILVWMVCRKNYHGSGLLIAKRTWINPDFPISQYDPEQLAGGWFGNGKYYLPDAFYPTHWMPLPGSPELKPCPHCGSSNLSGPYFDEYLGDIAKPY